MPLEDDEEKPCRACSDFKSWVKQTGKSQLATPSTKTTPPPPAASDCPLDKDELGSSTWGFLHSLAAYFPDKPTPKESQDVAHFFTLVGQFYPCEPCAQDFREDIKKNPPKTNTRTELVRWLCDRHNVVNAKLGKPEFDCSKADERWRDGWEDGSCG